MERGKWFRCSQPWLFGILESQKHCLLNIRVRSKFSYLEYSVLLLEIRINWPYPFCLWAIILHEAWDFLLHPPSYRLFTAVMYIGALYSHACVTSYTYHSWNICGKFKNRRRRESYRFQRRALERAEINCFLPKSDKFSNQVPPCDNCNIKNGGKRVKKVGQLWLTLTVQFWYVY